MADPSATMERLNRLEAESRRLRWMILGLCALLILSVSASRTGAQQAAPDVLRVKGLVVEDAAGRAAIVLGAPMAEGANSRTGLKIVDPTGRERIGISIVPNGDAVVGLDAPRGTGDERNPERISLNADAKGAAHIRFLDRRTSVAARMYLDPQNRVWLSFSDFAQTPPVIRRYGLTGEEVVRPNP